MVEKIRKSEEEKVIEMLKREGFRELNKKEIQKEPYKSIYRLPDCFDENTEHLGHLEENRGRL